MEKLSLQFGVFQNKKIFLPARNVFQGPQAPRPDWAKISIAVDKRAKDGGVPPEALNPDIKAIQDSGHETLQAIMAKFASQPEQKEV